MTFSVIRTSERLVRPSEQTPSTVLDLSAIDSLPVLRGNARTLHVYRHGQEVTKVIKEALSKALVPYYPLAGRLKESSSGQLQVECSGEGVWLVEAYANCTLDSVNYFDDVTCNSTYDELLPARFPAETQGTDPLVQMQVTEFEYGGFVVGIKFSHSICDGLGSAQFLNAVGEMARGLEHLSITPAWARNFFKSPSKGQQLNLEAVDAPISPPAAAAAMPNYKLEHANVDISMDRINGMKKEFQEATGRHCSAFEVVAATLWICRTRAVSLDQNNNNAQVKLVFFANCRHILDPPLPRGFYGNCFFPVTITASSDTIARASIADVVKLIQDAKAKLSHEFANYIAKGGEHNDGGGGEDPYAPPLSYATLFVSEWGRLGFNQLDFGWGPPFHVVPIQGSSVIPAGIVGWLPRMLPHSDSRDQQGIRLVTWCVVETHRQTFINHMTL